jgi:uncharacterized protein (TIGR02246 family)
MRAPCLAFAAVPLLAACGATGDPDTVLDTVRMTELAQIEALQAKDLGGVLRVYEPDATLVAPDGTTVKGDAAIKSEFEKLLADPNLKVDYKQGRGWAAGSEDLAVTTGSATITTTDAATGKPATTAFDYQTVWRKADGGPWKIVSDYDVAHPAAELTLGG